MRLGKHPQTQPSRQTTRGWVGATWGNLGVGLLIGGALARLAPIGVDTFSYPLDWVHWTALAAWVPFMAWSEGYRGFHRAFAPLVASRARYLRDHPEKTHYVALAPLFCFGLIHATRRRKIRSTLLALAVAGLVVLMRQLEQPWRGVVDLGVVTGLGIGLASLAYFAVRALTATSFDYPPEIPEEVL